MDIRFCVSQFIFITILVVDAHVHVQRLVSVVKKATVFEVILLKSNLLWVFCGQKDSMQMIFIKNCFLF
jgi:hypothetical protein